MQAGQAVRQQTPALPDLLRDLKSTDYYTKASAARALGGMPEQAHRIVPSLVAAFRDASTAQVCVDSLVKLLGKKPELLPFVIKSLDASKDQLARRYLVVVLGKAGGGDGKVIARLMAALKDRNTLVQREAMSALGDTGRPAVRALPPLLSRVRNNAVYPDLCASALKAIAKGNPAATPYLLAGLEDTSAKVRERCAVLLGSIRPLPPAAIKALVAGLGDGEQAVRLAVIGVLESAGPGAKAAVPSLMQAVYDEDWEVCRASIQAVFAVSREHRGLAQTLVKMLDRHDDKVRETAAQFIGRLPGDRGAPAVAALIETVERDKSVPVRRAAVAALAALGPAAQTAVPALETAIWQDDYQTGMIAIFALGEIGGAAAGAVPKLMKVIKEEYVVKGQSGDNRPLKVRDREEEARRRIRYSEDWYAKLNSRIDSLAVAALGKIGPPARDAVPLLDASLRKEQHNLRAQILCALWRIRPGSKGAVRDAIEMLDDESPEVQRMAMALLLNAGVSDEAFVEKMVRLAELSHWRKELSPRLTAMGKAAAPALARALSVEKVGLKCLAAEILGEMGAAGEAAVPALCTALTESGFPSTRHYAATALGKIKRRPEIAVPALCAALKGDDSHLRKRVTVALAAYGPQAKDAVHELVVSLQDGNQQAAEALGEIGPAAKRAVPALLERALSRGYGHVVPALAKIEPWGMRALEREAKSDDVERRVRVVVALGTVGAKNERAFAALTGLLADESPQVVAAARSTMKTLGPTAARAVPELKRLLEQGRLHFASQEDLDMNIYAGMLELINLAGGIGAGAAETVPVLTRILQEEYQPRHPQAGKDGKRQAVSDFSRGGHTGVTDYPAWLRAINGRIDGVCVIALGEIGPAARTAVPALLVALDDEDRDMRKAASFSLAGIAPENQAVRKALRGFLDKEGDRFDDDSLIILLRLGTPAAELARRFADYHEQDKPKGRHVRPNPARWLAKIRSGDIPFLAELLAHEDAAMRSFAARLLVLMATEHPERTMPLLVQCLTDEEPNIRRQAMDSLVKAGAGAIQVLPAVMHALGEGSREAAMVLAAIGPRVETVAALEDALAGGDEDMAGTVLEILTEMGSAARDAYPLLIRLLLEDEKDSSRKVTRALVAIGPYDLGPLLESLHVENQKALRQVLQVLRQLGASSRAALPTILSLAVVETTTSERRDLFNAFWHIERARLEPSDSD